MNGTIIINPQGIRIPSNIKIQSNEVIVSPELTVSETKTFTLPLDEFDMILEALGYTENIKYLNDTAKKEYKDLLIKLEKM